MVIAMWPPAFRCSGAEAVQVGGSWEVRLRGGREDVQPVDVTLGAAVSSPPTVLDAGMEDIAHRLRVISQLGDASDRAHSVAAFCRDVAVPELSATGRVVSDADARGLQRLPVVVVERFAAALAGYGRALASVRQRNPIPSAAFAAMLGAPALVPPKVAKAWQAEWLHNPDRPSEEDRLLMARAASQFLEVSGVAVGVTWESYSRPAIAMHAPGLVGMLAAELALQASKARSALTCDECGDVVEGRQRQRRQAPDGTWEPMFCGRPACRRAYETDRKRKQRARKGQS